MTVDRLMGWDPAALDCFAGAIRGDAQDVMRLDEGVCAAVSAMFSRSGWSGSSADAAAAKADTGHRSPEFVVEAMVMISRAVANASDALTAARSLLVDAVDLAASHGLTVGQWGAVKSPEPDVVPPGVPMSILDQIAAAYQDSCDAAVTAEAMAREALAAAREADRDAARVVDDACRIATGDESAREDAREDALDGLGDITDRDSPIPAVGTDPAEVEAWWNAFDEQTQAQMLKDHPDALGNLDGIPLWDRAIANDANLHNAVSDAETELEQAEEALDEVQRRNDQSGGVRVDDLMAVTNAQDRVDEARAKLGMYNTMVDNGRQIVLFDPETNQFAEVAGTLDENTENIAILVGGTGTDMEGMCDSEPGSDYGRAEAMVQTAEKEGQKLAVITYMGGPMPQTIQQDAAFAGYAETAGPRLAPFVNSVVATTDARVTVIGHSYGGSVVGYAEANGMVADNIVHVESAGAGPHVTDVSQYANPNTNRYTMTAPGDAISAIQGHGIEGTDIGLGADPAWLDGVVQLDTGTDTEGHIISGIHSHSNVLTAGSTSMNNIVAVATGGQVTLDPTPNPTGPTPGDALYPSNVPEAVVAGKVAIDAGLIMATPIGAPIAIGTAVGIGIADAIGIVDMPWE